MSPPTAIVPENASLRGRIVAKQDGVVAGLDVAKEVFTSWSEMSLCRTSQRWSERYERDNRG
jgi:nicotinate-nucleotide pyrophosphorylase